jgi:hypothetical protein
VTAAGLCANCDPPSRCTREPPDLLVPLD